MMFLQPQFIQYENIYAYSCFCIYGLYLIMCVFFYYYNMIRKIKSEKLFFTHNGSYYLFMMIGKDTIAPIFFIVAILITFWPLLFFGGLIYGLLYGINRLIKHIIVENNKALVLTHPDEKIRKLIK